MDVSSWTVPKIKAELLSKGLSTDGLKPALVARLNKELKKNAEALKKNAEDGEEEGAEGSEEGDAENGEEGGPENYEEGGEDELNSAMSRAEEAAAAAEAAVAAKKPAKGVSRKAAAAAPAEPAESESAKLRREEESLQRRKRELNLKKFQEFMMKPRSPPKHENVLMNQPRRKPHFTQSKRWKNLRAKRQAAKWGNTRRSPVKKGIEPGRSSRLTAAKTIQRIKHIGDIMRGPAYRKMSLQDIKAKIQELKIGLEELIVLHARATASIKAKEAVFEERAKTYVARRDAFKEIEGLMPSEYIKTGAKRSAAEANAIKGMHEELMGLDKEKKGLEEDMAKLLKKIKDTEKELEELHEKTPRAILAAKKMRQFTRKIDARKKIEEESRQKREAFMKNALKL
jgi:hypothetical protein